MQTARNLMQRRVIAVSPQTSAQEAIDLLLENNVSGLPVVDLTGCVLGIYSEVDRIKRGTGEDRPVQDLMTTKVTTVDVEDSLITVAHAFRDNTLRRLPVTENGVMVGIIGLRDLVRYIRELESTLEQIAPVFPKSEFFESELFESECWCNVD